MYEIMKDRIEFGWLGQMRKWKWLFMSGCEFSGGLLSRTKFVELL